MNWNYFVQMFKVVDEEMAFGPLSLAEAAAARAATKDFA
jgi:hypothetical protein